LSLNASRKTVAENTLSNHLGGHLPALGGKQALLTKNGSPTGSHVKLPELNPGTARNQGLKHLMSRPLIHNDSNYTSGQKLSTLEPPGKGSQSKSGHLDQSRYLYGSKRSLTLTTANPEDAFHENYHGSNKHMASYRRNRLNADQLNFDVYDHFKVNHLRFPKMECVNKISLQQGVSPQQRGLNQVVNQQSAKYLLSSDQSIR